jgi:hypothetical protein
MAAQGVDVSDGVTQEVLTDTTEKVAEDVRRTRMTARKQAWGLRMQAKQYNVQADRAESRARYAVMNGALGVASSGVSGATDIYKYKAGQA